MRKDWLAWPTVIVFVLALIFGPIWLKLTVGVGAAAIIIALIVSILMTSDIKVGGHTR